MVVDIVRSILLVFGKITSECIWKIGFYMFPIFDMSWVYLLHTCLLTLLVRMIWWSLIVRDPLFSSFFECFFMFLAYRQLVVAIENRTRYLNCIFILKAGQLFNFLSSSSNSITKLKLFSENRLKFLVLLLTEIY